MNHTRLWAAAVIIALIVVISFMLSVPHTRDVVGTPTNTLAESVPSITLHDVFKKGLHTITGSLEAPNACTTVTASAVFLNNSSSTERILIKLSVPEDSGVCLQLPTQVKFSTTISAPANLPISATVNGIEATTTVL
jgi:hypothetical protein